MKICVSLFLIAVANIYSAFVPMERARRVAENQYAQYCAEPGAKSATIVNAYEHKFEGEVTRYTFEFEKGFIMLTADDGLVPVLGYSDHGKVPKPDQGGGENYSVWFENYDRQIVYAIRNGISDEKAVRQWKDLENNIFETKSSIVVDRMIKSQWGSTWPWNDMTPELDGKKTYVGSAAVAIAQLVRYYRDPKTAEGSVSYEWNGETLSADLSAHTWNYDLMPETAEVEWGIYPEFWQECGWTQSEIAETSKLAYYAALSIQTDFDSAKILSSTADINRIPEALKNHWKAVDSQIYDFPRDSLAQHFDEIRYELDLGRPWICYGKESREIYYILDGYTDDMYLHLNWGWEGYWEGWFYRGSSTFVPPSDYVIYFMEQKAISFIPSLDETDQLWPSTELSGFVSEPDVIVLSWQHNYNYSGYKVYRTKNLWGEAELITETAESGYADFGLPAGEYSYHVVTVYPDGESRNSNSFNASLQVQPEYPVVNGLTAVAVGRTNIDLSWIPPSPGLINAYEDFKYSGYLPTGWAYQTANDSYGDVSGGWTGDDGYGSVLNENDVTNWHDHPNIIGAGNFFIFSSNSSALEQWLLSPAFTFDAGSYIEWTGRFRYINDIGIDSGHRPQFNVVTTTDINFVTAGTDVMVRDIPQKTHRICTSGPDGDPGQYLFDQRLYTGLETAAGDYARAGFKTTNNPHYSICFDDILIGSTIGGVEVVDAYEIYRNGDLAETFNDGQAALWTDTEFGDGLNEYYIKVLYPSGGSLPSERASAEIDKYPKPDYLSGTVSPVNQINLSWYMPYHHPPKWYTYIAPEDCFSSTVIQGINMNYRRVIFNAADLGYFYPITLDSIAGAFYDDAEGNWDGNNTFVFRIWYESEDPLVPTVLHTSPTQTAYHNKITTYGLATPVILTEDFNIEIVTTATSGSPASLIGYANGKTHSYFKYNPGDGETYYYGIKFSDNRWAEWNHMAYINSSEPGAKGEWVKAAERIEREAFPYLVEKPVMIKEPVKTSKELDYYKIYRNNELIGTSTTLGYTDYLGSKSGDLVYKVTAYYSNPEGESEPSNELYYIGVGIDDNDNFPATTVLHQNYPNPFNPTTAIRYALSHDADVKLTVFDIAGREVAELVSGRQAKGNYSVNFNAEGLSSGIYFYRLSVDGKAVQSRKMMMLK